MTALGQPLDTAALTAGEGVPEEWTVLGHIVQEEGRLEVRRTWLRRTRGGQTAVILDFAAGGRGYPAALPFFVRGQIDLRLVPTLFPQRAVLAGAPVWNPDGEMPPLPPVSVAELHAQYAHALAHDPWLERIGAHVGPVWLLPDPPEAHDLHGHALPLIGSDLFLLLAHAEGKPATLFGEWNGEGFEVISLIDHPPEARA